MEDEALYFLFFSPIFIKCQGVHQPSCPLVFDSLPTVIPPFSARSLFFPAASQSSQLSSCGVFDVAFRSLT